MGSAACTDKGIGLGVAGGIDLAVTRRAFVLVDEHRADIF
jgi:hypothetical protein